MARITIGIPVYNGEAMIGECLDCLMAQTYADVQILIADNCSTDKTLEICAGYAAKDPRIRLIRNATNLGHEANFRNVFSQCTTEYFCWRADDDYTSSHYIEHLVAALDTHAWAVLAAPSVITKPSAEAQWPQVPPEPPPPDCTAAQIANYLFTYHAGWFYGLWRTDALRAIIETVWAQFPHAYARDHLTLLRPLLNKQITPAPEAIFYQRIYSAPKGDGLRGTLTLTQRIARLETLMPLFHAVFDAEVAKSNIAPGDQKVVARQKNAYIYQRLRATPSRIFRLKLKRALMRIFRRKLS